MSRKKTKKNAATPCQLRNKKAVQLSLSPSFTYLPLSLSYQSPSEKVLRWALFYETESETWASLDILELVCLFVYFAIIQSTFRLFKGQQYLNNM